MMGRGGGLLRNWPTRSPKAILQQRGGGFAGGEKLRPLIFRKVKRASRFGRTRKTKKRRWGHAGARSKHETKQEEGENVLFPGL